MAWIDEAYGSPRVKRSVGRPVENPFRSAESEEEFVRRGRLMLDRYYHPAGGGSRLDFVFDSTHSISKTCFWSDIYIYLVDDVKVMSDNLQGFLSVIQRHFGPDVASDRTAVCKNVSMQRSLYVRFSHSAEATDGPEARAQRKYRAIYRMVVERWKETHPETHPRRPTPSLPIGRG